ncbi:squalene synthase HpnC [Mitsuaria sp. GD03876]|uniref:squalene synthase HpnC n=1 Tax=Mitsuaria sp. GD03876 TaxID=2975399 RepID=UPI002448DDC9|nr:squalene synthase HpnC [Mitsuaria sp. GD03876]MDH0864265.1 squalene synthase HpnC [Mitsuaria sp. GD03876]
MSIEHYENFPVASWLSPPALRPAIMAIYRFARTADDLADEGDAPAAVRLRDLADYRADLRATAEGRTPSPRWAAPVFASLGPVIARYRLPVPLLEDLLDAFEQDLVKTDYATRAELLDYCRRSANPVGRLLLHLYGIDDADALRRSDAICSALQLINFWQDFTVDGPRGRIYAPLEDRRRHGVEGQDLLALRDSPAARALIGSLCGWARALMAEGAPLAHRIPGRAGWELRLVVQGGLRILDKLDAAGHDALLRRPTVGASDAPLLLWRALTMRATGLNTRREGTAR